MGIRVHRLLLIGVALCAALTSAGTAPARVAARPDSKISPVVAARLAAAAPNEKMPVIIEGADPASAAIAAHGSVGRRLELIGGVTARIPAAAVQHLAADSRVSFVSPDSPIEFASTGPVSASSLATIYPGRDSAGNPWSAGATGQGVGIAVIDSGVNPSPDFGSRLTQVALDGQSGRLDDTVGHGTMVAAVAAGYSSDGKYIGIAPGANIYAINVNRAGGVYASDIITALKWVFDNAHTYNIRVVNLSLTETVKSSYSRSPLDLAIERLWASGVFVTVSAGNRGPGQVDFAPANDPLAFTVGAFDTMDTSGPGDDSLSAWSSGGTTVDGFAKPDLVAPGRHIAAPLSAGSTFDGLAPAANRLGGGYATINGTSFSAPQVAGAAAIIFQWHPDYSPDNVKWVLIAKQGSKPKNSKIGSLSLSSSYNLGGTPGRANQGVPALVCPPDVSCLSGSAVASSWDSSSWNSSSWNSSSWNSSSWNSSSWNSTADWDSSSWNSSSWNSSSWNSTSWNSNPLSGFDPWQ